MAFNKAFPVNVWGLSILIGSVCFSFVLITKSFIQEPGDLFQALMLLVLFAGVFSCPTFILCYLLIRYLSGKRRSFKSIRIGAYMLALTGIISTAIFFVPTIFEESVLLIGLISYIAALTISFFTIRIGL